MLMKAEKQIYKTFNEHFMRQEVLNQFLVDRLPAFEVKELVKELDKFDEDNKPENKNKREEDLISRMTKMRTNLPPKTKKEEPPE